MIKSVSVHKLSDEFDMFLVIDVREKWEWDIAHVKGARHISLKDLPLKLNELDPTRLIAVMCHHGVRSARAVEFLISHGFANVHNIDGGIDAWSREIDPLVPVY